MKVPNPTQTSNASLVDESLRRRFERAWVDGRPQPIGSCLPPEDAPCYAATVEELVHIDMEFRWKQCRKGDEPPPLVEEYIARFRILDKPDVLERLVQQEVECRRASGNPQALDEYRRRFPGLAISGETPASLALLDTQPFGDETRPSDFSVPDGAVAIPGYELLDVLGQGGMGVVYRARQQNADRLVALKLIRGDLLRSAEENGDFLTRFQNEARAAARLQHENIVAVYDVGVYERRQYYSMRYVEGAGLSEILREGPLEGRLAARYLKQAAEALAYAHEQGVLHRDLKPQNILIDAATDRPLITDFGLAKLALLDSELTRVGEIIGTPCYMAPEQARDASCVGPSADVYALGATFYHLLTGRPPFQSADPVETLRQLADEEPVPPRRLNSAIDRDLETICLKCLEKSPERRYASAAALADDLGRYLRDEPIAARPLRWPARLVRWSRRRPAVAASLAAACACALLAIVATAVGYLNTQDALARSRENARRYQETVDDLYVQVSENELLSEPGMQPLREKLLRRALVHYEQIIASAEASGEEREELARVHYRIASILDEYGSPEAALGAFNDAERIQQQIASQRPREVFALHDLAATLNGRGVALHRLDQTTAALADLESAARLRRSLVQLAPEKREYRRRLANTLMNMGVIAKDRGDYATAYARQTEAQAIRREARADLGADPLLAVDLAKGRYNLAQLAFLQNEWAKAKEAGRAAATDFEALLAQHPHDFASQRRLGWCYRLLADILSAEGDFDSAHLLYQQAGSIAQTLALRTPDSLDYQSELLQIYHALGAAALRSGRYEEAQRSLHAAQQFAEQLVAGHPRHPAARRDLAAVRLSLADLFESRGEISEAVAMLEGAAAETGDLVEEHPDSTDYRQLHRQASERLARLAASRPESGAAAPSAAKSGFSAEASQQR